MAEKDEATKVKDIQGTSGFTHIDDATANIHTSTVEGANHFFHGEPMPPKEQLAEVVLGPPAFGSPDPRTLGHQMIPVNTDSGQTPSAPELDKQFQDMRNHLAGTSSSEDLDSMKKDDLLHYAQQRGIDVNQSMTKDDIREAIDNAGASSPTQADSALKAGASDAAATSQGQQPGQQSPSVEQQGEGNYSSQNKAELLELARNRSLDVNESNSKAEIISALEDNDKQ